MRLAALVLAAYLSGCAWNVTLMPRDSGTTYSGEVQGNGMGAGTMTVNMAGATCTGPAVRAASNDTFGFAATYGTSSRAQAWSSFGTTASYGDRLVKAILTCTDGHGLRCEIVGRNAYAGGICLDDTGRVFDAVLMMK